MKNKNKCGMFFRFVMFYSLVSDDFGLVYPTRAMYLDLFLTGER